MQRTIKLGSRESKLALWQTTYIQLLLQNVGVDTKIVLVKSDGDIDLVSPLYELGIQGIFTKSLDSALLSGIIDIAVHSLKDVPTKTAENICIAAVPPRGTPKDVLIFKKKSPHPLSTNSYTLATSSLRRKAQWLNRYPAHHIVNLRGNINSRLDKLVKNDDWDGAIFAAAGIERISLEVPFTEQLDWMLPAPAQGALAVVCRSNDHALRQICAAFNHYETAVCVNVERQFLRKLMGGCSMPVGALAVMNNNNIKFEGNILSIDGAAKASVSLLFDAEQFTDAGYIAAQELLSTGGEEILKVLKNNSSLA